MLLLKLFSSALQNPSSCLPHIQSASASASNLTTCRRGPWLQQSTFVSPYSEVLMGLETCLAFVALNDACVSFLSLDYFQRYVSVSPYIQKHMFREI